MEEVGLKYQNVTSCYQALLRSTDLYQKLLVHQHDSSQIALGHGEFSPYHDVTEGIRTSVIKNFELLIELIWKHLKWVLEEQLQVTLDQVNPRAVITQSTKVRLITEQQALCLIDLIQLRNKTSHIYKEEFADYMAALLCKSVASLGAIIQHVDPARRSS